MQVLAVLLRVPGQLVTTEELRKELWPADTFVDFEHGVRNAVARLRAVLGDTAERPRFVETLPRRGYRFIGTVAGSGRGAVPEAAAGPGSERPVSEIPPPLPSVRNEPAAAGGSRWRRAALVGACLVGLAGAGAWIQGRFLRDPAPVHIRSLAVLPLENLSGDPAQDYFVDGVTDELITAMAKLNSVKVISRTSVMQYKGVHSKPLPQIAHELGVDAVVEGSLVRSGDRVRLTAQLIDSATDRHIWADEYECPARDILRVEGEISETITARLQGIRDGQQPFLFNRNPIDSSAHEAYLQGRYLWNRRTQRALDESIRYFTQAIEREPGYTDAYAGRAEAYTVLGSWVFEAMPPEEVLRHAKTDAERAVQLDATNAEARLALASVRYLYEWDGRGAETEFQRALRLCPSCATAHQWYGNYLCNQERFEDCLAETARAHALDPAYLVAAVDVGIRLYDARRYREAAVPVEKVLEFNPDFMLGHLYLGQIYEANRRYREAIVELRKAVDLSGGAPIDIGALGNVYAVAGDRAEARKTLDALAGLARQRYVSGYESALIRAGLGENDRALAALEQAFQERSSWMTKLRIDPRLDPLRGDARFVDLTRRVGLTP